MDKIDFFFFKKYLMKNVQERVSELLVLHIFWLAGPQNLQARFCLVYAKGLATALLKKTKLMTLDKTGRTSNIDEP